MITSNNIITLGYIPARGGSKGIPKKNMQLLNGISLLERTINVAKSASFIDSVFVSTDDSTIADISRKMGTFVPFLRGKKYADDKATIAYTLHRDLERLRGIGIEPKVIIIFLVLKFNSLQMDILKAGT